MIYLPRGLTIYLPRNYAFALIARVFPKVDAFRFLETVGGLEKTQGTIAFIVGLVCFVLGLQPIQIFILTLIVPLLIFVLRNLGIILPGQIKISVLYSRITGFFIIIPALAIMGLLTVGVVGTLSFFLARIALEGITVFIDNMRGKKIGMKMEETPELAKAAAMYYAPINSFMLTYKIYAHKFNAPIDQEVTEEELKEKNWEPVWDDLAAKWPQVVARYPEEDNKE